MTQRKINARDLIVQVETAVTDTFIGIENVGNININLGEGEETVDTTDFDSDGVGEHEIMQRGAVMEIEGQAKQDHLTGELQPGRARVEEMAGESKVGADSLGRIRFRYPADTEWRIWTCTFSLGEQSGGPNDKLSWGATVKKSGPTTTAAVS